MPDPQMPSGGLLSIVVNSNSFIFLLILSLFINQSLSKTERVLDNPDKKDETETQALMFLLSAIGFLILFAMIVSCNAIVNDLQFDMLKQPLNHFEHITFALMLPILFWSDRTQKTFRLRAHIW